MINLLIPCLVVLEATDGIITYSAVSRHLVGEANPFLAGIAGTGNFLIIKIFGAAICGLLLWVTYKRFPKISLITTSIIVLFYLSVLTWNLNILLQI